MVDDVVADVARGSAEELGEGGIDLLGVAATEAGEGVAVPGVWGGVSEDGCGELAEVAGVDERDLAVTGGQGPDRDVRRPPRS